MAADLTTVRYLCRHLTVYWSPSLFFFPRMHFFFCTARADPEASCAHRNLLLLRRNVPSGGAIRCKGVECESRNEIKFSRLFFGLMTGVWNWRLLSLLLLFLLLMVYAVEVFWWEWKIKNPFLLSLSFLNFLSCILSSIRTQKTAS